jgi:hypothetical protein
MFGVDVTKGAASVAYEAGFVNNVLVFRKRFLCFSSSAQPCPPTRFLGLESQAVPSRRFWEVGDLEKKDFLLPPPSC